MEKKKMKKVLVTGGNGLVGEAIKANIKDYPELDFYFTNRKHADLTNESDVLSLFNTIKPDYVIHAGANVGGIKCNLNYPAEQFYKNIIMNSYMIHYSHLFGVKKIVAFASNCAFPDGLDTLTEDKLHGGLPHRAHYYYGFAKRMVDVQLEAYSKQYGLKGTALIPGNMFGEHDNFNLDKGHVVPSLIRKCYEAKRDSKPFIVWGTGSSLREFLYAKDVGKICIELLNMDNPPPRLIVSGEKEYTIKQIVEKIADIFEYNNIQFDSSMPDGQKKRPSDRTLFTKLFPDFKFVEVEEGLKYTIEWFQKNYPDGIRL